jgi:hypothetical protein
MFSMHSVRSLSPTRFAVLVALLRLVAAIGLCFALIAITTNSARTQADNSARPLWDPAQFLLNAFLLPALEQGAVPLRWFEPRPALHCGPNTTVQVNGKPLVAGTAVPVQPFELAWHAQDCRPFGIDGPRFNGGIKLTVYREDWGFSAGIVPEGLRYTWPDGETQEVRARAGTMPQFPHADDPD